MIWLLWKLVTLPIRLAFGTTKLGVKTGYRTGRIFGYRRLFVFLLGVAIGLLIAPVPGATLRARLRARLEGSVADPVEAVRHKLGHDPRTWHLPQPEIEVIGGRVVLRGTVPHETGRTDLEAAARSVSGITHVDNRLEIADAV